MNQMREKACDGLDLVPDTNQLWRRVPADSYCDLNPHAHVWQGKISTWFSFCLAFFSAIRPPPPSASSSSFIPLLLPSSPFLPSLPPARPVCLFLLLRMVCFPRAQFWGFVMSLGERTVHCLACWSHGTYQKDEGGR